ncbi:hypothetical protein CLAFUW4_10557 [Fulvia fulva]|uniref:Uncharacterized protein n=1 Tax=Passalora fulva TaxID=5499 RepID=A0A9Q8LG71_PASFU|nr:uncharacterized protein CLAFUR5_05171 [Fulvia fulva]KAK4616259.1 hypothetical protein CLAFUR4_10562 [Fulvia fulva]KAK4616441.1 hypothetical protein CLAFUR0_10682 [Fulvia fulva]UJO16795.1 hypothetical protein CLAFUR5_05171 [Fulvia fulva]WPV18786.1 hypothetical protein CLAFUW4_10557 [Fulvia fulva]WPV34554.1 hypothetical protein CLAFUW7_10559 [Fulvia fulva]
MAGDYIWAGAARKHGSETRCVILIDFVNASDDMMDNKSATLSVWKPKYAVDDKGDTLLSGRTVNKRIFRNGDGTAGKGALRLSIRDILPSRLYETLSPSAQEERIKIPFAELCGFIEQGEKRLARAESNDLEWDLSLLRRGGAGVIQR